MSNTNNPFLLYLTEENNNKDNDNQNNNKEKNDSDISKILEEGSATAVPPPAYDEIVRPQPTQPGFDYPSYPPPPFSGNPAGENENYNQSPNVYMNSRNQKRGFRICCSGDSRRNKTCGCGWVVVLIIFIVLGTISIINNNACNSITLGPNPEKFFFDPSTNANFRINVEDARIRGGEIRIFQQPPRNPNQAEAVDIEVYTGSSGITPKFDTSSRNGMFELKISQIGFSIFNIPPRCMKLQINVFLPSISTFPNTIIFNNLDVTMTKNDLPYQQNITLLSNDGDIRLNDVSAQNLFIRTDDGDISGTITTISNELNIMTDNGDLDLVLGNVQAPFNSKLSVLTDNGDVSLRFDGSSFSGSYTVRTDAGRVLINNNKFGNQIMGTVGNGTGNLNIVTDDGDVRLLF